MKSLLCTALFALATSISAFAQQADTLREPVENQEQPTDSFIMIEQEAMPRGGMKAFYKFLYQNIKMPKEAIENGVEGTAYVRFIIDEEGNVPFAEVVEGREVGFGIDEEAIRLIKLTKWTPGVSQGKNVKQRKILPIKFTLSERQKKKKKKN